MLAHLAYVSVRKKNCTDQEIDKILASCKTNNAPLDVTGVLIYSDTRFVQYVEGESAVLTSLYDKIKKDPRHERAVMISYSPISSRIFPSWQMGSRKLASDDVSYLTDITSEDKMEFTNILSGKETEGGKVRDLLQKFFKN